MTHKKGRNTSESFSTSIAKMFYLNVKHLLVMFLNPDKLLFHNAVYWQNRQPAYGCSCFLFISDIPWGCASYKMLDLCHRQD